MVAQQQEVWVNIPPFKIRNQFNEARNPNCKAVSCDPLRGNVSCLLQIDLRDDPKTMSKLNELKEKPISPEQGHKLAKEVGLTRNDGSSLFPGTVPHRDVRKTFYSQTPGWRPGGHSGSTWTWTSSRVQRGTGRPLTVCSEFVLSESDQKENKSFQNKLKLESR